MRNTLTRYSCDILKSYISFFVRFNGTSVDVGLVIVIFYHLWLYGFFTLFLRNFVYYPVQYTLQFTRFFFLVFVLRKVFEFRAPLTKTRTKPPSYVLRKFVDFSSRILFANYYSRSCPILLLLFIKTIKSSCTDEEIDLPRLDDIFYKRIFARVSPRTIFAKSMCPFLYVRSRCRWRPRAKRCRLFWSDWTGTGKTCRRTRQHRKCLWCTSGCSACRRVRRCRRRTPSNRHCLLDTREKHALGRSC